MEYTRKHFEDFALMIKQMETKNDFKIMVTDYFKKHNSKFDESRFLKACE